LKVKVILHSMVLIILVFSILFVTDNSITGMAVRDPGIDFGEYRLKHTFSAEIPDLANYDDMRLAAATLLNDVEECEKTTDLERCIRTRMDQGKGWSINCGDAAEQAYASFVEEYLSCAQSEDDYCLCSVPLDSQSKFEFTLRNISGSTYIYKGVEYNYPGHNAVADVFDNRDVRSFATDRMNFEIDSNKAEVDSYHTFEYKDEVLFFKRENEMVLISYNDKEGYKMIQEQNNNVLRECARANKRTYRFCIDAGKKLRVTDIETKDHDLAYRFALDFRDEIPPAQTEVKIGNIANALEINWTLSTEPDVDHYSVYVNDKIFTILDVQVPSAYVKGNTVIITEFYFQDATIPIAGGNEYFVAVVPVDQSGNYIDNPSIENYILQEHSTLH